MPKESPKRSSVEIRFVGLESGQLPPRIAAYEVDPSGRPLRKLAISEGSSIDLGEVLQKVSHIALGPDSEDIADLPPDVLVRYRAGSVADRWQKSGLTLGRNLWERFRFHFTCVSGQAFKCRPWWWDLVALPIFDKLPTARLALSQSIRPDALEFRPHLFPWRCLPLCDGIVEVYERECCCTSIHVPDLLDRLRDILGYLPIPLPDPVPDPWPGPDPIGPFPFRSRALKASAKSRRAALDPTAIQLSAVPPRKLLDDYEALRKLPNIALQREYIELRPHLHPLLCRCTTRKIGETALQPGGRFDFCFLDWPKLSQAGTHCHRVFAYKVKQLIGGSWVVVYDGLAAHDYFGADDSATLHSHDKRAIVCNEPDRPGDGTAYAMLDVVGTTEHFNFPDQTAESRLAPLATDDGTVVFQGTPGCPWASSLALHLLITPEMKQPAVGAKFYRLKVAAIDDAGQIVGTPEILDEKVAWERRIIGGTGPQVWEPVVLGPLPAPAAGGESNLFTIPYWELGVNEWRMGIAQAHQVWDTTGMKNDGTAISPNGRYALILELFDKDGKRIKPNGAPGTGQARPFVFKRWKNAPNNAVPVIQPDLTHAFWVDNSPVVADIVDLRKGGTPNSDECQFMIDAADTEFSIGFRAYHVNGVDHAGNGDANSFMQRYDISWQRGLNGSSGTLDHAPIYPDSHHDVAETGSAESSDSLTFEQMLTGPDGMGGTFVRPKCTFSVTLYVTAKHTNGSTRLVSYDRSETASFALEIG